MMGISWGFSAQILVQKIKQDQQPSMAGVKYTKKTA